MRKVIQTMFSRFLPRILKSLGITLGVGAVADQALNEGQLTEDASEAAAKKFMETAGGASLSATKGILKAAFDTFTENMARNGAYAAIPAAAAVGALSGDGISSGALSAGIYAGATWLGVALAESKGYKLPGIDLKNMLYTPAPAPV